MHARGGLNQQLNCQRQSYLLCHPQLSQEYPGKSRGGDQSRWLNHRGRSLLATGTQLLQPGRPERSLGVSLLLLQPHLGRHQLDDLLFFLQLRLKATSLLPPRYRHPPAPSSQTRWEIARSRIKGRFKDYITPPLDNIADLPCKPASSR